VVNGWQGEVPRLLTAAETAAPVEAVDVVARDLRRRFEAQRVSFLIVDLTGKAVFRLSTAGADETERGAERIKLFGSVYEQVIRTQQLYRETAGRNERLILPVTNRGDAIGLLELTLPDEPGDEVVEAVWEAAHVLAYIVIANQRFTDLYTWGKRTTQLTLPAEIQHRLLPPSLACEAAQFALCGHLEPTGGASGDTFDYTLDRDTLHLSVTDPMGHDLHSALLATVLVGALRNARRGGAGLAEQAHCADSALAEYGQGHATGQLLRVSLHDGSARLVNAGHPWPLRMRDGQVEELQCAVDPPFGLALPERPPYRVQEVDLRPHDRLVMFTDGMLEGAAATADLPAVLRRTRHLHPRETALALTGAVMEATDGRLEDDATVLCLDWHGVDGRKPHVSSGADARHASPHREAS
jgi:serine phosphatase RsbU (regulator of sigma subunit)